MDVDIDTPPAFDPRKIFFRWPRASLVKDGKLTPHPVGVYPQAVAVDPVTELAAIPYEVAEQLGFLKVDFLHLNVYQHFASREEIERLLKIEPDWLLLQLPSVQQKLFQLSKHGDLLSQLKPKSIEELADCMALIRPGKKALLPLYVKEKVSVRRALYAKGEDGYSFKKSHAVAYAMVVVLQLHLIAQNKL